MDIAFKQLPDNDDEIELGKPMLVRLKDNCVGYYVVYPEKDVDYFGTIKETISFVEADGEQYARWQKKDIEGYIPLSDLDKIPLIENTLEKIDFEL